MAKHKRHSSTKKKLPKKLKQAKNLSINKYWFIVALLLPIVIATTFYFTRSEDLGPQLAKPPANAIYKQANQPIDVRVADLLSRMTLEEKIGQMSLVDKKSLKQITDISKYSLGGVLSGAGAKPATNSPQGWLDMVSQMKQQALDSRLGIPILYGVDANHGHANVLGATVFPHAIGLGATGDPNLVNQVAQATANEVLATGVNWSYSPSLDAPKDIRWGRVYEAYSDSPSLNSLLGASYINGTQRPQTNASTHVLASAKHYLGTGAMIWGESNHKIFKIDQGKTAEDQNALVNEYLPPFKSAVDADVASVMIALNEWGNARIIDNKYLVTDKLKTEMGFKGFVVSDWYGVYEYAKTNPYRANIQTINAGLDMAMLPYDYKDFLFKVRAAVKRGEISQARIDDAVSRILYQKFKAGLFESTKSNVDLQNVGSANHRALARKAAASSAVLLKNNSGLLPLSPKTKNIHVAGSGADNVGRQCGAWTVEWQGVDGNWLPNSTSILQGIRQSVGNNSTVEYDLNGKFEGTVKADVGIAIVSEKPYAEGWGDNEYPTLSTDDIQAIENLKRTSQKVVVVIVSGRPLFITDQLKNWDALVAAWLPGTEGAAVADVLFGAHPFKAKLPIVWPANIQQIPINSDGTTADNTTPLFSRSYGL